MKTFWPFAMPAMVASSSGERRFAPVVTISLTAKRGLAGHLIAEMLGHADERITMKAYAAPSAAATGVDRRGLEVLNGGVQYPLRPAK